MKFIVQKAAPAAAAFIIALVAVLVATPAERAQAITCPTTSSNTYGTIGVLQWDLESNNTVRPTFNHPDKTLYMRGSASTTGTMGFVDFGPTQDSKAPQFATLFNPSRVPTFVGVRKVPQWDYDPPPTPGSAFGTYESHALPGGYTGPDVVMLEVATIPGEELRTPESGYSIGSGNSAFVMYADSTNDNAISLHFTSEDSITKGYTVQIQGVCVDPELQDLYDLWDNSDRNPVSGYGSGNTPHDNGVDYTLPGLPEGMVFGVAKDATIKIVIRDSGAWMDPRDEHDWWQIQPVTAGPALGTPAAGSTIGDLTPDFTWGAVSGATDYQIQIDDSSNLGSPIKTVPLGAAALSYTYSGAPALTNGTYYWRVRGGAALPYSGIRSFTINVSPPAQTLLTPSGATNVSMPTFAWTKVGSADATPTSFTLTVKQGSTVVYGPTVLSDATAGCNADTSCSAGNAATGYGIIPDGAYSWTITPSNTNGTGPVSAAKSFSIDTAQPAIPQITGPFGNKNVTASPVTLKAKGSADTVSYFWQVSNNNFVGTFYNTATTDPSSIKVNLPVLKNFGTYQFRVQGNDAAGNNSSMNQTGVFIYSTMKTPKNNGIVSKPAVSFAWGQAKGLTVTTWSLQVATDSNFASQIAGSPFAVGGALTKQTVTLPTYGQFYWRVSADGGTPMPAQTFFYTPAKKLLPASFTADSTPSFSWGSVVGETQWDARVDNDSNCASFFYSAGGTGATHAMTMLSPLPNGFGTYYWNLRLNGATLTPCMPFDYTLMKKPLNNNESTVTQPAFSWNKLTGATWRLQVDDDSAFGSPTIDTLATLLSTAASFKPGTPLAPGTYYWRLSADGGATYMPGWKFIIH